MTCKTCRRTDVPDDCGPTPTPTGSDPCHCCGAIVIADESTPREDHRPEEE